MPIFDFRCPACNTIKEIIVKSSEDKQTCEVCHGELNRLPASPAFILKGAGFTSNGTYGRAKDGPYIDPEIYTLSDAELNRECGLPEEGLDGEGY